MLLNHKRNFVGVSFFGVFRFLDPFLKAHTLLISEASIRFVEIEIQVGNFSWKIFIYSRRAWEHFYVCSLFYYCLQNTKCLFTLWSFSSLTLWSLLDLIVDHLQDHCLYINWNIVLGNFFLITKQEQGTLVLDTSCTTRLTGFRFV